jgi:hypothetical protein
MSRLDSQRETDFLSPTTLAPIKPTRHKKQSIIMLTVNLAGAANQSTPLVHPYYPLGVDIPSYAAGTLSTVEILAISKTTCLAILVPTWHFTRRIRPELSRGDLLTVLWFVLCGCIHLGLEGMPHVS